MPYWVRTVYAGKCKEVKKYYSRRHKPKEKRIKREEPTRETQENVNIRKQTEQLRWKLLPGRRHVRNVFLQERGATRHI